MNYFYVYILASKSRTLYIGVTNDLARRVTEHKSKQVPGFTAKYNIDRLVYFEQFASIKEAILREKLLKNWSRGKKVWLIESMNPTWENLAVET